MAKVHLASSKEAVFWSFHSYLSSLITPKTGVSRLAGWWVQRAGCELDEILLGS